MNVIFLQTARPIVAALIGFLVSAGAIQARAQTPPDPAAPRLDLYGDPLPPGAIARMGSGRLRATGVVYAVAFSPDGRTFASAGRERAVYLWDAETGRQVARLGRPNEPFLSENSANDLAFSPDGRLLAVARTARGREDPGIEIFDLERGELRAALILDALARREASSNPGVESVLFTPDGRHLIGGGDDGSIRMWSVATGDEILVRKWPEFAGGPRYRADGSRGRTQPPAAIVGLALSPDGRTLAVAANINMSTTSSLALWPLGSADPPRVIATHASNAAGLAFSPDGRRIYTGGDLERWSEMDEARGVRVSRRRAGVRVWDIATGERVGELRSAEGDSGVNGLALLPDGETLAVKYSRHVMRLWNVESGEEIAKLQGELDNMGGRYGMAVSPGGRRLATAGPGVSIGLWDLEARAPSVDNAETHGGYIRDLAYTPDGSTLVSLGSESTIRIWDATSGEPRGVLRVEDPSAHFSAIAMGPRGERVASAGADGVARIWSLADGKALAEFDSPGAQSWQIAFSPDGRLLAVGYTGLDRLSSAVRPGQRAAEDDPPGLEIWNIASGEIVGAFNQSATFNDSLWFTRDGERIIAVDGQGTARIWEHAIGVLRFKFEIGDLSLGDFALAPDGAYLVSVGAERIQFRIGNTIGVTSAGENAMLFWDLETGEAARRIPLPEDAGFEILLTSDGSRAVTFNFWASNYSVWDLATGIELDRIEPPRGAGTSAIALAPDGRSMAIGLTDGTILVYPLPDRN